jgi:cytoskeletal protein RodZ
MWPFKKNQDNSQNQSNMSPELQEFYEKERRQQTAKTWLFGIATILVTAVLVWALFLAGRWVIRKFQDQPTDAPVATENGGGQVSVTDNPVSITVDPNPSGEDDRSNTTSTDEAVASHTTTSTTETLPNTGPTETLMVFVMVTAFAAVSHRLFARAG